MLGQGPPTPAIAHLRIDEQGFAWLPEDSFLQHFAPDVDPVEARVMCAVQQPPAASTLDDVMTTPAWKTLPTWFAVAQHDEVIPPDAERHFAQRMGATTVEVDSSHVVMIAHPDDVTALIQSAVAVLHRRRAAATSTRRPATGRLDVHEQRAIALVNDAEHTHCGQANEQLAARSALHRDRVVDRCRTLPASTTFAEFWARPARSVRLTEEVRACTDAPGAHSGEDGC